MSTTVIKKCSAMLLATTLIIGAAMTGCASQETDVSADATRIVLSDDQITVDGEPISEVSASAAADDQTAEASADVAVYASHDIVYYEDRDTYDSGNAYGEGTAADKHSAEEAAAHTVVNITQPGTYHVSGQLSQGQIAVDLGEDAKRDPNAVVTLVLDGVDLTCSVAPAIIFYDVYECDEAWVAYDEGETEDYEATSTVDTSNAGANVIIADGSVNNIDGSYVARIYKDSDEEKKLHKYDGAFYSKMTMNVTGGETGSGVLNITAANEGLDTEQHLTINGGKINITSQNDGINTNEDNVSVTTINGGSLHIVAGLGAEGDGVDSNGYLVINGGTVLSAGKPQSDSGLDSDLGSYINGGTVLATGSTMDWAESDSDQVTLNLQFASMQNSDEAIIITDEEGIVLFAYDPDQDETAGVNNRGYQGAVISSPNFAVGETYSVYIGGDVQGTDVDGLFDVDTVTGFDGSTKQEYTGTDVGMGRPGGMGGRPEGMELPEGMERPDGMDRPDSDKTKLPFADIDGVTINEDGTVTINEDGAAAILEQIKERNASSEVTKEQILACTDSRQLMELMGGMNGRGTRPGEAPATGQEGGKNDGQNGGQNGDQNGAVLSSTEFYMTDKVNSFSGVSDEGTN